MNSELVREWKVKNRDMNNSNGVMDKQPNTTLVKHYFPMLCLATRCLLIGLMSRSKVKNEESISEKEADKFSRTRIN